MSFVHAPCLAEVGARRLHRGRRRLAVVTIALATLGLATAVNAAANPAANTAVNIAAADPTPLAAGEFVPLAPASLVDSASGTGWSGKLRPGATDSVTATGAAGIPATGVLAVMLHITTSNGTGEHANTNGNVWAWPAGAARPSYAVVANAPAGSIADNTAIVQVGTSGQISFYHGPSGTAVDVRADVEGYVTSATAAAAGATFAPVMPSRIIDTADGTGGRSTPITASAPWTFHTLGVGTIPTTGVSAVALNVGARSSRTDCWVQVQPAGTSTSSTTYPRVNTYADYTAQQLAVVAPDASGNIVFSTNCASTGVYADVEGYYLAAADGSTGEVYVPITPARVIDTRTDLGITGKLTAGRVVSGSHAVAVTGVGTVPSDADTVALNVGALDATSHGYNTIWTDGTAQPTDTSTVDVDPDVIESNLVFVKTGPNRKIDVAAESSNPDATNDLYVDIEGYFRQVAPPTTSTFATPHYYPTAVGDTYFNTVGPAGGILATTNDTRGIDTACGTRGSDIAILQFAGADPADLGGRTVNCMTDFGPLGGGNSPDGCSWKTGGITRIGKVVYLAVARQLRTCTRGLEANGLQPSFHASIMKSVDGGRTWTNPWGATAHNGAAPPYIAKLHRYKAMFPGQSFSAPFFIQYGPGNTQTVDGANKYLYAVSNDGYAYNGNYLHLARVPLNKVQTTSAWQFYHGTVGGGGVYWTNSPVGATRVLQAKHGISQPAIQYVPALKRYVLVTFSFTRAGADFPTPNETPYTHLRFYSAPKPWGPWTKVLDQASQRSLWCTASPCQLVQQPGSTSVSVGSPDDWLGLYDPALVQKFVFTHPLDDQALFTSGDWKNSSRYPGEVLYRLHAIPLDLTRILS